MSGLVKGKWLFETFERNFFCVKEIKMLKKFLYFNVFIPNRIDYKTQAVGYIPLKTESALCTFSISEERHT